MSRPTATLHGDEIRVDGSPVGTLTPVYRSESPTDYVYRAKGHNGLTVERYTPEDAIEALAAALGL